MTAPVAIAAAGFFVPEYEGWILSLAFAASLVVVWFLTRHVRPDAPAAGAPRGDLLRLRQTIRPSSRMRIHVVEFDESLLVLSECGDAVTLLQSTAIADLSENLARAHTYSDAGVNLKDTPIDETEEFAPRTLQDTGPQGRRAVTASSLADFKSVLDQARRSHS